MIAPVYSKDGSHKFNKMLHDVCCRIAEDTAAVLGNNFEALILGGGYGRGEGGIVIKNGTEKPYNDLDLTLIIKNQTSISPASLESVSRKYEEILAIHVDFSRPLTLTDLQNLPHYLMWQDLLNGHVVLNGPPDILLTNAPKYLTEALPAIEASKLLLNRGAGLLWALLVKAAAEPEPDVDFIRRNYYKCALSLGDALLIAYEIYTTEYTGRDKLVSTLADGYPDVAAMDLTDFYAKALAFKFRPDSMNAEQPVESTLRSMAKKWGDVFLHVEKKRTGIPFDSLADYIQWAGIREKEQHTFRLLPRNFVRNLQQKKISWNYPREKLYRDLPALLELTPRQFDSWKKASMEFLKTWTKFN
jgi:hypothetical protein